MSDQWLCVCVFSGNHSIWFPFWHRYFAQDLTEWWFWARTWGKDKNDLRFRWSWLWGKHLAKNWWLCIFHLGTGTKFTHDEECISLEQVLNEKWLNQMDFWLNSKCSEDDRERRDEKQTSHLHVAFPGNSIATLISSTALVGVWRKTSIYGKR